MITGAGNILPPCLITVISGTALQNSWNAKPHTQLQAETECYDKEKDEKNDLKDFYIQERVKKKAPCDLWTVG